MRALTIALLCSAPTAAFADFLLVHPYAGSKTTDRREAFVLQLPQGPIASGKAAKTEELRGQIVLRTLKQPKGASVDEVHAWYEAQLKAAGMQRLWSCKGSECGAGKGPKPLFGQAIGPSDRFVTARLPRREQGDVWIAVHVREGTTVLATAQTSATAEAQVLAAKEAAAAARRVTAVALAEALDKDGHASLSDILYQPGEVALRPEASGTVAELAKLLHEDPGLRLHVVGHTDDVGDYKRNLSLSRRRAQWLVDQLTKAGVDADRLRPEGLGPLAPVASNKTEEGRAKNRRVELVSR